MQATKKGEKRGEDQTGSKKETISGIKWMKIGQPSVKESSKEETIDTTTKAGKGISETVETGSLTMAESIPGRIKKNRTSTARGTPRTQTTNIDEDNINLPLHLSPLKSVYMSSPPTLFLRQSPFKE